MLPSRPPKTVTFEESKSKTEASQQTSPAQTSWQAQGSPDFLDLESQKQLRVVSRAHDRMLFPEMEIFDQDDGDFVDEDDGYFVDEEDLDEFDEDEDDY